VEAGLVDGETLHVDATLVRGDVSWESLVERHVDQVLSSNDDETSSGDGDQDTPSGSSEGQGHTKTGQGKKASSAMSGNAAGSLEGALACAQRRLW